MKKLQIFLGGFFIIAFTALLYLSIDAKSAPLQISFLQQPMPTFRVAEFESKRIITHKDIKGPALINFFASWCGPCLKEHPLFVALSKQGIPIYGISLRDKESDLRTWLNVHGQPFHRIGFDKSGQTAVAWGVRGIPETFLIDKDGKVRYRKTGPLTADDIVNVIQPAFKISEGAE